MQLQEWVKDRKLDIGTPVKNVYEINGYKFLHVHSKDGKIIDDQGQLIIDKQDTLAQADYFLFTFGEYWFYTPANSRKIQWNEFNYIRSIGVDNDCPYLGVISGNNLCSGAGTYKNWVRKARQLGYQKLGICEDSLSGAIQFQKECEAVGITPVIGERLRIGGVWTKVYVIDEVGWRNLLSLHKLSKVDHDGDVPFSEFNKYNKGIVVVIDAHEDVSKFLGVCDHIYYQFNYIEYARADRSLELLQQMKNNIDNGAIPVFITDSYYIHKSESYVKKYLHEVGHSFYATASNQYFKAPQDWYEEIMQFSKDDTLYTRIMLNTFKLGDLLGGFRIKIKKEFYLPEYIMNESEAKVAKDNIELLWHYITVSLDQGFCKGHGWGEISNRIQAEIEVIQQGGFVDYFLILADILRWARSQKILVGMGRGSVGGSLIAYLLGITNVNPLDYDLLFERFLNKGRIGKSLPDIDVDFQASRREDVKKYIEAKYGSSHVCSIGVYTTFKMKQAIKDFARVERIPVGTVNYMTAMIEENHDWHEIVDLSIRKKPFKDFVMKNSGLMNKIYPIIGQQKTSSIHPAGVVIVPNNQKIWEWIPVKLMDGVLVSEWDGVDIEDAGFLKADILALKQLDKFNDIFSLIQKNHGHDLSSWSSYTFDNPKVYKAFSKGFNQDVFQFQGDGMAVYSKQLKPDNIHDLIAMNALYRPGVMDINAHMDYLDLKMKRKTPTYDTNLEPVTRNTYGLYVYQEQIMQAVQKLGGFTLTEADEIRKAMGKKIKSKMDSYMGQFIEGAQKNGCSAEEAQRIWEKLEGFSRYGFNKSHATTYAMMGYVSQYLKVFYPIEFWSVSLSYASSDELPGRLEEIGLIGHIKVCQPDINKSGYGFNTEDEKVYWSLSKIDQVGDIAVNNILEERRLHGKFFSLEEFCKRVPKKQADKRVVLNMILSGCFDEICNIYEPKLRYELVKQWSLIFSSEIPSEIVELKNIESDHSWIFLQKQKSGLGEFDYKNIIKKHNLPSSNYLRDSDIFLSENLDRHVTVAGIILKIISRKGKRGEFGIVNLEGNSRKFTIMLWSDAFTKFQKTLEGCEGKIMVATGIIKSDKYNGGQSINSTSNTEVYIINV